MVVVEMLLTRRGFELSQRRRAPPRVQARFLALTEHHCVMLVIMVVDCSVLSVVVRAQGRLFCLSLCVVCVCLSALDCV